MTEEYPEEDHSSREKISTKTSPTSSPTLSNMTVDDSLENATEKITKDYELPEHLEVLFIDDESILRKLFVRTIRKVAPTWHITEANNGERALQLVQEKAFDLIFCDQYMPCAERPLLGIDVVRRMRTMEVPSLICGLSANDMRQEFLDAGADSFLLKPFPCKKEPLVAELMNFCGSYIPANERTPPSE